MVADEASPSVNGVFENVNTDEVKINYFHNDWNDTCVFVCVCADGEDGCNVDTQLLEGSWSVRVCSLHLGHTLVGMCFFWEI